MRLWHSGFLLAFWLVLQTVVCATGYGSSFRQEQLITVKMATSHLPGGVHEPQVPANSLETEGLGRFAIDEHNKKQNAMLEFARVVEAKEQVVAGMLHHLSLEAIEAGKKKLYEAKVWVKPWLNFKELQEFNYVRDIPTFTSSDLGAKRGDHAPGWQDVPAHDPVVQEAADHAIQAIKQRSNSLFPYELQEIVNAEAEVADETAKFRMLIKVKRGTTHEKLKVEVHRTTHGTFHLNHMEPHTDSSTPDDDVSISSA